MKSWNKPWPPRFRKSDERWAVLAPGYWISDRGRVYSFKTRRILKSQPNSSGYYRVGIWSGNQRHNVFIHIKVVAIFGDRNGKRIPGDKVGMFDEGLSIDHLDRDKRHNEAANLELVTHQENCIRRSRKKETNA